MRYQSLVVLSALVVALACSGGCFSDEPFYPRIYFSYLLMVETSTPLENVTFLLPLPVQGDRPAIGSEPVSVEFITGLNNSRIYSTNYSSIPEQCDLEIDAIDGAYYLRLTAPYLNPADQFSVHYSPGTDLGDDFTPEIVSQMIDTLHPFGNTSLFYPKQNLTPTAGNPVTVLTDEFNRGCTYSYTVPVYAQYENGTQVKIYSSIRGVNEWSESFDMHPANKYSDTYELHISGDPKGWISVKGEVVAGIGNYREWQLAPASTSGE